MTDSITFANEYEKNLYDCELSGQISDGMYENSSPDWQYWTSLETKVGTNIGRTQKEYTKICKKDNYSFRGLYDIVGDRIDCILKLTALGFDSDFIRRYHYRFESVPNDLGDYEEGKLDKLLSEGKYENGRKFFSDYDEFALEALRDRFGEEKMYDAWNFCYYPDYQTVLKGVRKAMKTLVTGDIEQQDLETDYDQDMLKRHLVLTVLEGNKIRVIANSKEGLHYVSFPNALRTEVHKFYYVGSDIKDKHDYTNDPCLRFNGRNYIATAHDGISELTKEETAYARKMFRSIMTEKKRPK